MNQSKLFGQQPLTEQITEPTKQNISYMSYDDAKKILGLQNFNIDTLEIYQINNARDVQLSRISNKNSRDKINKAYNMITMYRRSLDMFPISQADPKIDIAEEGRRINEMNANDIALVQKLNSVLNNVAEGSFDYKPENIKLLITIINSIINRNINNTRAILMLFNSVQLIIRFVEKFKNINTQYSNRQRMDSLIARIETLERTISDIKSKQSSRLY